MMPKRATLCPVTLARVVAFSLGVGLAPAAVAGESEPVSGSAVEALRGDMARIKTELEEVKTELRLLRQLLTRSPSEPTQRTPVKISVAGNPSMGKADAPVTLIEFSDYQCPFCRRFFNDTLPALKAEYVDTGKVRYVFRDYPLDRIHPKARKAAEAARCVGEQGKYWQMHDLLFQNQQALEVENLKEYARRLHVDAAAFDACLDGGKYSAEIQKDFDEGGAAGVRGTPGFFIGKTRPDNTIEGVPMSGAQPVAVFRREIEKLLNEK
jgi:protein-disulfide isomerase